MTEWLSIAQLSKKLEIPETTARRYVNNFEEYFRYEKIGRGKKFHPESMEILRRIATLYSTDYESVEIKKILADEYVVDIEDGEGNDITSYPSLYDLLDKFDRFQQEQEAFNREWLKQLQEQQTYIKELLESRDQPIQENHHHLPDEERTERMERIMVEHKVKSKLEKEALTIWNTKPDEERLIKVGWFRKEEDKDKRDLFIKSYINEHFETYLKQEFAMNASKDKSV